MNYTRDYHLLQSRLDIFVSSYFFGDLKRRTIVGFDAHW